MSSSSPTLYAIRLALCSAVVVIPLLGCLWGPEAPTSAPPVDRCSVESSVSWTPDSIAVYDASDPGAEELGEGSWVQVIRGAQGSDMVGLELVVRGDAVPQCLDAQLRLDGYFDEGGPLRFDVSEDGRTGTAMVYEISNGAFDSSVTAVVGDLSVDFEVAIIN